MLCAIPPTRACVKIVSWECARAVVMVPTLVTAMDWKWGFIGMVVSCRGSCNGSNVQTCSCNCSCKCSCDGLNNGNLLVAVWEGTCCFCWDQL